MPYQLNLPEVSSKFGAPMGRPDLLPDDRERPYLMHLTRIRFEDYDYDSGGAYWGASTVKYYNPNDPRATFNPLYCAEYDDGETLIRIFVRPTVNYYLESEDWRESAKTEVRRLLPNARFYR